MEMMTFSNVATMINPMDELIILGEEAMGVLVRTPDGEEVMMKSERMTNYLRNGNTLIPNLTDSSLIISVICFTLSAVTNTTPLMTFEFVGFKLTLFILIIFIYFTW